MVSFWSDEIVLKLIVVVVVAQLCEHTKKHSVIHFKQVSFILWELDLTVVI